MGKGAGGAHARPKSSANSTANSSAESGDLARMVDGLADVHSGPRSRVPAPSIHYSTEGPWGVRTELQAVPPPHEPASNGGGAGEDPCMYPYAPASPSSGMGAWRTPSLSKRSEDVPQHAFAMGCDNSISHSDFIDMCSKDAEAQGRALQLAINKAQAALDYFSRLEHNSTRSEEAMSSSAASSRETVKQDASDGLAVFEGEQLACTVERYVKRIIKYSHTSECNVIIAFLYLERIRNDHCELELTPFNLQRLLLCACMIAAKMFDDIYYTNRHWAEIGELTCEEMNNLELKFLAALDFKCHVQREEYNEFVAHLDSCPQLLGTPLDILRRRSSSLQSKRLSVSSLHTPLASLVSNIGRLSTCSTWISSERFASSGKSNASASWSSQGDSRNASPNTRSTGRRTESPSRAVYRAGSNVSQRSSSPTDRRRYTPRDSGKALPSTNLEAIPQAKSAVATGEKHGDILRKPSSGTMLEAIPSRRGGGGEEGVEQPCKEHRGLPIE